MVEKKLNTEIDFEISKYLLSHNYKKRKDGFFRVIDDNNYGIIRFSKAHFSTVNHIYVTPHIGLLNVPVENIMKMLTSFDSIKNMTPTIHIPLGYLMPDNQYKEWDFVKGDTNQNSMNDMLKNIEQYAPLFWSRMKEIDNLFYTYKNGKGIYSFDRPKYLPVLYYLLGEKNEGLKIIEEHITQMSTPRPPKGDIEVLLDPYAKGSYTSGYKGIVDPSYLDFAERYKLLD